MHTARAGLASPCACVPCGLLVASLYHVRHPIQSLRQLTDEKTDCRRHGGHVRKRLPLSTLKTRQRQKTAVTICRICAITTTRSARLYAAENAGPSWQCLHVNVGVNLEVNRLLLVAHSHNTSYSMTQNKTNLVL